jgi:hypothetical protein
MESKVRTHHKEWACTKFCRIGLDDDSVESFILWLCDRSREQCDERMTQRKHGEAYQHDPVEFAWGWDAPRHRMAKLLWKALLGNASEEEFYNSFSFHRPLLQIKGCASLLAPIRERLRWVMEGSFTRQTEDRKLGQGDWGEQWWLPSEQAAFVRTQLQQTRADLIEQSSEYEYTLKVELCSYVYFVVQARSVPCLDPTRVYIGTRCGQPLRASVWVQSESGRQYPLKHGNEAYLKADGTGFEWGYGGHGPLALAHCILLDALNGDLPLAMKLEGEFFRQFTLTCPRDDDFRLSRTTVMRWLEKRGYKARWEAQRQAVVDRVAEHEVNIKEKEDRLIGIRKMGGLRIQRFDVVPATFESALYLDLMRMLEHSDFALRCCGCGLPIPYDNSGRANRQRARSKNGTPIYHSECFAEHSRARKKTYWQRRSRSPEFREQERQRAHAYRELR